MSDACGPLCEAWDAPQMPAGLMQLFEEMYTVPRGNEWLPLWVGLSLGSLAQY